MKIYLDNCCFNRPFDDQTQLKISLESQAKLAVQHMILAGTHSLVWSYMLEYENSQNPFPLRKESITEWKDMAESHITEREYSCFGRKFVKNRVKGKGCNSCCLCC